MNSPQENLLNQALRILEALTSVTKGDHFIRLPLRQIGWDANAITDAASNPALPSPYDSLKDQFEMIAEKVSKLRDDLDQPQDTFEKALNTYKKALDLIRLIQSVTDATVLDDFKSGLDSSEAWKKLGDDLVSLTVSGFLEANYPSFYFLTRLLTITISPEDIDPPEIPAVKHRNTIRAVRRTGTWWPKFKPLRGLELISNPCEFLKKTYLTTNGEFTLEHTSDRLFQHLTGLANVLGLRARYGIRTWMEPAFGDQVETAKHTFTLYLQEDPLIALSLNLSPLAQGNMGLVIVPIGFPAQVKELEDWTFNIDLTNNGPEATSFALGPDGPTVLPEGAQPKLNVEVKSKAAIQVGAEDATHLYAKALVFSGYAEVAGDNQHYSLNASLDNGRIKLEDLLTLSWSSLGLAYSSDSPDKMLIQTKEIKLKIGTGSEFDLSSLNIRNFNFVPPNDLIIQFGKMEINVLDTMIVGWEALTLHWKWGASKAFSLSPKGLTIKLKGDQQPLINFGNLNLEDFHYTPSADNQPACLIVPIAGFSINKLLKLAGPNIKDAEENLIAITLRLLFDTDIDGIHFREIRADWKPEAGNRTYKLPGFNLKVDQVDFFSLIFGGRGENNTWQGLGQIALIANLLQNKAITLNSSFAWQRPRADGENERELQNDDSDGTDSLFELTLTPSAETSLLLLAINPEKQGLPILLQQLITSLIPIISEVGEYNHQVSSIAHESLKWDTWVAEFKTGSSIELPFLRSGDTGSGQFIKVVNITKNDSPTDGELQVRIALNVQIAGTLSLDTYVDVALNLSTFALNFRHDKGLTLVSNKPQLTGSFLGLKWFFNGVKKGDSWEYLTLATNEYNYSIILACKLELEYSLLGDDPIAFKVERFQLSDAGVSLSAEVLERPARLNGLDTQFTFSGSTIEVVDSTIKGFTLNGAGPLPPALLGECTASIALQFEPEDNVIKLKSGCADLQRNKPLECKGTGFQFSVTAIGLEFIDDGAYHLYFTLTGRAELSAGADDDGPLALLSGVGIDLVDCPICGDPSVIIEHLHHKTFLIPLPEPITFPMLGCFLMEVRGIAFEPKSKIFGRTAAMRLSGKIGFADAGDADSDKIDLHNLYIGLPKPGSFLPQISMDVLPLNINMGEAFSLNGTLNFLEPGNDSGKEGFEGEGRLRIQGLPETAASFSFVRLQQSDQRWVKAWFIFLEVRQVSFPIPAVQLYLREVGLGFGYRYTLASIKQADNEKDLGKLIKDLRTLSRTQGNLSKLEAWSPDADTPDPQWTIALRGLFSQSSAAVSPLDWQEEKEKKLKNAYLFDAVMALRSDFTFLMVVRAWLNTNYYDFFTDKSLSNKPLFSGFVLITPRQKRLLAQLASNPDGDLGSNPPLPDLVQKALKNGQFSATLLIEPGLVHYELGWPNQLQWSDKIGPLKAEFRGGYIMRVSRKNLVLGNSVEVRAELEIGEKVDGGFLGVEFQVLAKVAYGARYIGVVPFTDSGSFALYGAAGIEASIDLSFQAYMRFSVSIRVFRNNYTRSWTKTFRLSATVDFTAAIEIGVTGNGAGLRGHGTLALPVMGHQVRISIRIGVDEERVSDAQEITKGFLQTGLEARDVGVIPGTREGTLNALSFNPAEKVLGGGESFVSSALADPALVINAEVADDVSPEDLVTPEAEIESDETEVFSQPHYILFVIRKGKKHYFALLPKGEGESGFLPPPPVNIDSVEFDFHLDFGETTGIQLRHWKPELNKWTKIDEPTGWPWKANWHSTIEPAKNIEMIDEDGNRVVEDDKKKITLDQYLLQAFLTHKTDDQLAIGDPATLQPDESTAIRDSRLTDPAESDYEAAVRGAEAQFRGSPFFRHDEQNDYDKKLTQAFANRSVTHQPDGSDAASEPPIAASKTPEAQQAEHLRGSIVQDIIADLKEYVEALLKANGDETTVDFDTGQSVAFQMGLIFEATIDDQKSDWLKKLEEDDDLITIQQRTTPQKSTADGVKKKVRLFNTPNTGFQVNPPRFVDAKPFVSASTIALAWKLAWEEKPPGLIGCQCDPEHHLLHYEMRRRVVDGPSRLLGKEQVITRCPADTLLETDGKCKILKSRFALVDHFSEETPEQRAALPERGITYLYSITPIDYEGQRGVPLTLVITRYPDTPPLVPTDAVLTTHYDLTYRKQSYRSMKPDSVPSLLAVEQLILDCTLPIPPVGQPSIRINKIYLLFRPLRTLPLGSYGQDSATADSGVKALPAANAIPLPDDIVVELLSQPCDLRVISANDDTAKNELINKFKDEFKSKTEVCAVLIVAIDIDVKPKKWTIAGFNDAEIFKIIPLDDLDSDLPKELKKELNKGWTNRFRIIELAISALGRTLFKVQVKSGESLRIPVIIPSDSKLFPLSGSDWQPQAWRVFIQTEAAPRGGTPGARSALVPVRLQLEVHRTEGSDTYCAIRPVPELEWLPLHCALSWLPAVDADVETGLVHVPMPTLGKDGNTLIEYQQHPGQRRGMRFHFNQGSSAETGVPLGLVADYQLLQLDIDAHTTETLNDKQKTLNVLKPIRTIDLLPANDLYLTPGDTRITDQWEAWYPSTVYRHDLQSKSKDVQPIAWHSWRDSMIVWPEWGVDAESNNAQQSAKRLHPLLRAVIDQLENAQYGIDLQSTPPIQPMTKEGFLDASAADADPYGWGILQRFGLSMTLSIREQPDRLNQLVTGTKLLKVVEDQLTPLLETSTYKRVKEHLHLELLYQPCQIVNYKKEPVKNDALLGIIQVSLRPVIEQYLHYGEIDLSGSAGLELLLRIHKNETVPRILVVQSGRSSSEEGDQSSLSREIEISAGESLDHVVRLPLSGKLRLMFRSSSSAIRETRITIAIPLLGTQICKPTDDPNECPEYKKKFDEYFARLENDPTAPVILKKCPPSNETERQQILKYLKSESDRQVIKQVFDLDLGFILRIRSASDESNQQDLFGQFEKEFKLKRNICAVLIVAIATSTAKKWTIAGFNDAQEFTVKPIDDPNTLLLIELNKGVTNRSKIIDLATSILGHNCLPLKLKPSEVVGTPSLSTYFTSPNNLLASEFSNDHSDPGIQWQRFKQYAERLNVNPESEIKTEKKIDIPIDRAAIAEFLPRFLLWSQRFFDHSGVPGVEPSKSGWLAAAYPVNTSPAYASPDQRGRLRYDHINADRWCHNYRFYLQPRGRYELLWRSLLAELKLSSDLPPGNPEPKSGGIDVVLERTHPLSCPLILSSRRLDQPTSSGQAMPPGKTWEVIIARHPEQQLDSSNQTLRRRLGYQQQAFTLTREFAEADWVQKFIAVMSSEEVITNPADSNDKAIIAAPKKEKTQFLQSATNIPAPPKEHPSPEPLMCSTQLEQAITTRLPSFQQGAMVLQWQGLPHFYNFHLTVVAQAAAVCSLTTTVVQKAFEYRSPPPKINSVPDEDYFVKVRLERLWDSINDPEIAEKEWSSDRPVVNNPSGDFEVCLSESAFPDPRVIYQVIHEFSGNVEVQLEISANIENGTFEVRRLGRQYKKPEKVDLFRDGEYYWLKFELMPVLKETEEVDPRMKKPKIRSRRGSAVISEMNEIDTPHAPDTTHNGES